MPDLRAAGGKRAPNPGSPEAVEAGCLCPVIDNHYGAGMPYPSGPAFWINSECPLHNKRSS